MFVDRWTKLLGDENSLVVSHTNLSATVGEALSVGDIIPIAVQFHTNDTTGGAPATDATLDNTGTGTVTFTRRVETAISHNQKKEIWEARVTAAGTPTIRMRYLPTPGTTTAGNGSLIVDPFRHPDGVAPSSDEEYVTSFAGSENPLVEDGRWHSQDETTTKVQKVSGAAYGTQDVTGAGPYAPFDDSRVSVRGYGPNAEMEGTIVLSGGLPGDPNLEVAIFLRLRDDLPLRQTSFGVSHSRAYQITISHDGAYANLSRMLSDTSLVDITTPPVPATGDVFRARIEGQRIRIWWNDAVILDFTDDTADYLAPGHPGFGFFVNTSGTDPSNTDFGFSDMTTRHLAHSARSHLAPTTATDAATSYPWTTLEDGCLIYGAAADMTTGNDPGTVGTGFTLLQATGGVVLKSMYRVQPKAGPVAITLTPAAGASDYLVAGCSFTPAAPENVGYEAGSGLVTGSFTSFIGEAMTGADDAGVGAYTLVAESGTYALTGTAAGVRAARLVTAVTGTYTLTGTATNLTIGYQVAAAAGTFTWTGTAAGLRATRLLDATAGSYTWTGTAATLSKGRTLVVESGSYVFTGAAAGLFTTRSVTAAAGAYTWTGAVADLRKGRTLAADAGVYAMTGTPAALRVAWRVAAEAGAYTWSGTTATLSRGRLLTAAGGAFALTGSVVTLQQTRVLTAASGVFVCTGTVASLEVGRQLVAAAGTFAWSGSAATLRPGRLVLAAGGTFVWAGFTADLTYSASVPPLVALTGKYAAEHASALADIGAATGFAEEHASALRDLQDAGV